MKIDSIKLVCMAAAATLMGGAISCARVQVDPIEVKPIHITMDVNIKVDQQLNDFFAYEDKYSATQPSTTTAPTTQTSAR